MTTSPEPEGRRPLKTRGWQFFQRLAARLANAGITPNAISVASVFFALAAGVAVAGTGSIEGPMRRVLWMVGAVLIQLRLIANLLDGMVAIEGGKASPTGELYNEVPDRLSDPAIMIGAGYAIGGCPVLGLAAALASVFVAYVRAIGASVGAGQVFQGPCAKPQRMVILTLVCLLCSLLPPTWQPIHEDTGIGIAGVGLALITVGCCVTAARRLRTIAAAMRSQQRTAE